MEEKQLIIGGCLKIVATKFENISPIVSFDYIEHQADPYYSDSETSIDINKEIAIEIISFLNDAFELNKTQEA